MAHADIAPEAPKVAIVGGGLIGVILGLGLAHRNIPFTIYERADAWHEIGAGVALTSVARRSMQLLHPVIFESLRSVAKANHFGFWDGYSSKTKEEGQSPEALHFLLDIPSTDYWCCMRSQFLKVLTDLLPEGCTVFNKELDSFTDDPSRGGVELFFKDGTTATADTLLACDGIHSRTRQILLGPENAAAHASFTHQVGYRTTIPVAEAIEIMGEAKGSRDFCIHIGPNAYVPSYPMMHGDEEILNLTTVIYTEAPWAFGEKMVAPGTKDEVVEVFKDFDPMVRELISKFPDSLMKWGIFDMADNPAPTYASGRVAILGDAAHASTPFLGAGGAMGIEDALVMATVLGALSESPNGIASMPAALQAYSDVRFERSQGVVQSSREMGVIFQGRDGWAGSDGKHMEKEAVERAGKVGNYDINAMVDLARSEYLKRSAATATA